MRLPPQVLIFLQALLASRKHKGEQEATALLKEAVELHFSSMQGLPLGSEYFEKLDPLFLVCIAREYLFFCPRQVRAGRKAHLHRGSWRGGVGWGRAGVQAPTEAGISPGGSPVCSAPPVVGGTQCFSNVHVQHADRLGIVPVQILTSLKPCISNKAPGNATAANLGTSCEGPGTGPRPCLYPREVF